jgi:hypothetical protein
VRKKGVTTVGPRERERTLERRAVVDRSHRKGGRRLSRRDRHRSGGTTVAKIGLLVIAFLSSLVAGMEKWSYWKLDDVKAGKGPGRRELRRKVGLGF